MERKALYEKIKTQTWQQQLGNLASTLATISTQATIPQQDKLTALSMVQIQFLPCKRFCRAISSYSKTQ